MAANIWRQRFATSAATLSLAIAVAVPGAGALAILNVNHWLGQAGRELRVWAHLKPDVPVARSRELRAEVRRWPQVASCRLITREEAWRQTQGMVRHPAMRGVPNPLGDALSITVRRTEYLAPVAARLWKMPERDDVIWSAAAQRWMVTAASVANVGTLLACCLLGGVAAALFWNTFRLTLFSRRREIAIMQLVGARGGFVAAPYVIEGLVLGLVGSAAAAAALFAGYAWLVERWPGLALHASLIPVQRAAVLAWPLVGAGCLLGVVCAALSVQRYLRCHLAGEVSF